METGPLVFLLLIVATGLSVAWLVHMHLLVRALMVFEPDLWLSLGSPTLSLGGLFGGGFVGWVQGGGEGATEPRVLQLVGRTRGLLYATLLTMGLLAWCALGLLLGGSGGVRTGG